MCQQKLMVKVIKLETKDENKKTVNSKSTIKYKMKRKDNKIKKDDSQLKNQYTYKEPVNIQNQKNIIKNTINKNEIKRLEERRKFDFKQLQV